VLLVALTAVTTIIVVGNNNYTSHRQPNTEILATYVPAPALDLHEIIRHSVEHISGILDGGVYGTGTSVIEPWVMPSGFSGGPLFGDEFLESVMMLVEHEIARNFLFDTVEVSPWHYVDWRLIDNFVRFSINLGLLDGQVYNFAWDCGPDCPLREILRNIE